MYMTTKYRIVALHALRHFNQWATISSCNGTLDRLKLISNPLHYAPPLTLSGDHSLQTYIGRDKLNYPDKARAAAASPDSALSKGKVYSSSPISQPPPLYQETSAEEVHGGGEGGKTGNDGGTPKAAIHSPNPAALSTSSQQDGAVSMRMESFAPISDMPPPQFHTRTRDLRREAAVRNSADSLPAINPTGRASQERPTSAS